MSTIHLTNWSSRKLHGPGRKLSIMAAPRAWEHGEGRVDNCTPDIVPLRAVQAGIIDMTEYRRLFMVRISESDLAPGVLCYTVRGGIGSFPIAAGDTLLCACSREAGSKGECHRVWCAAALKAAGWDVVLDGVRL